MEHVVALQGMAKVANASDSVLNSECCYTFHTPYTTDHGIVVHLSTFAGTILELANVNSGNGGGGTAGETRPQQQQLFVRIVQRRDVREAVDTPGDNASTTTSSTPATAVLPTKLALGGEGGFPTEDDKYEIVTTHSVVVLEHTSDGQPPTLVTELPYAVERNGVIVQDSRDAFPDSVRNSVESIVRHAGMLTQRDVETWHLDATEVVPVSKYAAALPFVDNGVTIDPRPSTWRCAKSGDADNLWLNLSTGYIGGGRKHWDGSGGSNGALDHFNETGQLYPLVVKLGTITSDLDTADCYSYAPDEDGPVKVPRLAELLQKRGINVAAMQKTVKSTAELEVELNATYAFDAITESGAALTPVSGPGLQGLQNLGNSCYINSVLQCLFSLSELASRYGTPPHGNITEHPLLQGVSASQAPSDLLIQTTKVASALTSGAFGPPSSQALLDETTTTNPKYRLAPRMFKHVIGKDHPEFRTGHQQDAEEFWRYLVEQLDRAELAASRREGRSGLLPPSPDGTTAAPVLHPTSNLFAFATTDRLVCAADGRVKYETSPASAAERIWSLPIPMDRATTVVDPATNAEGIPDDVGSPDNKRRKSEDGEGGSKSEESTVVPTVPFAACVEAWATNGNAEERRWPHLHNAAHPAAKQTSFVNFPRYLVVQLLRYTVGPDWTPIKLEVNVDVPEEIDLNAYKSTGPQDGEDLVPEVDEDDAAPPAELAVAEGPSPAPLDENALSQLMDMGFTLNSSKRALSAVGGANLEAAMNWVFEHNMDPDFNDPLPEPSSDAAASGGGTSARSDPSAVDEATVLSLVENLGCFTADQVRAALRETGGAADRAADWLFSHMDDLDSAIAAAEAARSTGGADSSSAAAGGVAAASSLPLEDGPGQYVLKCMISHIGKNTGSGHYVAHVKKDGQWVIFNDEKVALSSQPPFPHAYLYVFQRKDTLDAPNPYY